MSLQGLTDQTFEELYRARDLFGSAPQPADFGSTAAVASVHQALAAQHAAATVDWHGAGSDAYTGVAGAAVGRLGRVVPADHATSAAMNTVAATAATGRRLMDGIIAETHSGVAAIAPTTDTPAGRRQLTEYLPNQLRRAQVVVQGGAQQSAMAAAGISSATGGYRSTHSDTGAASSPGDVIVDDSANGNHMLTVRGVTFKQDGGPPAPPPADDPLTSLLQKLTQPGPQAALTPDEIRALVNAEVQGKLNDAQRFDLWQMLKKAGKGWCVLAAARRASVR